MLFRSRLKEKDQEARHQAEGLRIGIDIGKSKEKAAIDFTKHREQIAHQANQQSQKEKPAK